MIVGHNIFKFDLHYVAKRAKLLRLPGFFSLGRLRGQVPLSFHGALQTRCGSTGATPRARACACVAAVGWACAGVRARACGGRACGRAGA